MHEYRNVDDAQKRRRKSRKYQNYKQTNPAVSFWTGTPDLAASGPYGCKFYRALHPHGPTEAVCLTNLT